MSVPKLRFPWPQTDPDGCQLWMSELACAFATDELWEKRGSEIEAWDIEHAADQVRMFLWNVAVAGALHLAWLTGTDDLYPTGWSMVGR